MFLSCLSERSPLTLWSCEVSSKKVVCPRVTFPRPSLRVNLLLFRLRVGKAGVHLFALTLTDKASQREILQSNFRWNLA